MYSFNVWCHVHTFRLRLWMYYWLYRSFLQQNCRDFHCYYQSRYFYQYQINNLISSSIVSVGIQSEHFLSIHLLWSKLQLNMFHQVMLGWLGTFLWKFSYDCSILLRETINQIFSSSFSFLRRLPLEFIPNLYCVASLCITPVFFVWTFR